MAQLLNSLHFSKISPLSSPFSGLALEQTSLSCNVLRLRNATRGAFGKMAFNVGIFL